MAGIRKLTFVGAYFFFNIFFKIFTKIGADNIQCISQNGKPIDWYIVYKLPSGDQFYYMDVDKPQWQKSQKTMRDSGHAVYNTLAQVYQSSGCDNKTETDDLLYLMYNDEIPEPSNKPFRDTDDKASKPSHKPFTDPDQYFRKLFKDTDQFSRKHFKDTDKAECRVGHGHTKGVIAFDTKSGFWLVHSVPKFPNEKSRKYEWPDSAHNYGQTFLCISMATQQNMEEIGEQLLYNYPGIYDKMVPASFQLPIKYPKMAAALSGKHVTGAPWYRETKLVSLNGFAFHSFAKYAYFDEDLYSAWLAPRFKDTLLVETWQNGINKLCSNCTGEYKVFNIEAVRLDNVEFTETRDHAKWAVTNTTGIWTCIGDINRQESQMCRPGGTVCFQNQHVWTAFHSLVTSYHKCGPYRNCVPP